MPSGSLYKSYGVSPAEPGLALVRSTTNAGNALKDAFDNVGSLLKEQEQSYIEENTFNMQQHIKNSINTNGLQSAPMDMDQIKHQFGKYIDLDAVASSEQTARKELKIDALNKASIHASNVYDTEQDYFKAGEAFGNILRQKGFDEEDVTAATSKYANDHAYIEANHKAEKAKEMNKAIGRIMMSGNSTAAMKQELGNFDIEDQPTLLSKVKELKNAQSALSVDQNDEIALHQIENEQQIQNYAQARLQEKQTLFGDSNIDTPISIKSSDFTSWKKAYAEQTSGILEKLFNGTDNSILQRKLAMLSVKGIPKDIARGIIQTAAEETTSGEGVITKPDLYENAFDSNVDTAVANYINYRSQEKEKTQFDLATEQNLKSKTLAAKESIQSFTSMLHKFNMNKGDAPTFNGVSAISGVAPQLSNASESSTKSSIAADLNRFKDSGSNAAGDSISGSNEVSLPAVFNSKEDTPAVNSISPFKNNTKAAENTPLFGTTTERNAFTPADVPDALSTFGNSIKSYSLKDAPFADVGSLGDKINNAISNYSLKDSAIADAFSNPDSNAEISQATSSSHATLTELKNISSSFKTAYEKDPVKTIQDLKGMDEQQQVQVIEALRKFTNIDVEKLLSLSSPNDLTNLLVSGGLIQFDEKPTPTSKYEVSV